MFEKVLAAVMGFIGVSAFAKNADGKSEMTSDQEKRLTDKWGSKFVEEFKNDLLEYEKNGNAAEDAVTAEKLAEMEAEKEKYAKELKETKEKIVSLESEKKEFQATIAKLEKQEIPDTGIHVSGRQGTKNKFKPDMGLLHNKVLDNYFNGDQTMQYTGDGTINTEELKKEFGKYVSSEKIEILNTLMAPVSSTKYMTTVITDKTEWRASQTHIESVLQQFTPYWTPSGKAKFTPLKIANFKLKINVPIKPSDIMEDIIGYFYDESLKPEDMPIVKYIIEVLVRPVLEEDRENALASGEFKEVTVTTDGEAGSDPMESMDGYLTILKKLKKNNTEIGAWLLDGVTLTQDNIFEKMDTVVDSISKKYKRKKLTIHADPDLITMYGRAYRAKYPNTKNEDGENMRVDFSKLTFAPLDGMTGTKAFFITPKENFKHLRSKNLAAQKIWMQGENYDVKVFGEWWEATGFAIAEAIFAYLPPEESGSKATSSSSEQGGL